MTDNELICMTTQRLVLRRWKESDAETFAAMNASPEVMRHYPATLSREESDEIIAKNERHFDEHGFGRWAVEIPNVAPFIGFVGIYIPAYEMNFSPCVEIGWRIAEAHWNKGYATEAAQAAMKFGMDRFEEVVSFTSPENKASQRVMQKLGMSHDPKENFDHPLLPADHRLCCHVLYRMNRERYAARKST